MVKQNREIAAQKSATFKINMLIYKQGRYYIYLLQYRMKNIRITQSLMKMKSPLIFIFFGRLGIPNFDRNQSNIWCKTRYERRSNVCIHWQILIAWCKKHLGLFVGFVNHTNVFRYEQLKRPVRFLFSSICAMHSCWFNLLYNIQQSFYY